MHGNLFRDKKKEKKKKMNRHRPVQKDAGDDTLAYLREKMEMDRQFKRRELRLAEQREQMMQNMLAQQQAQTQAIFSLLLINKKEE